MDNFIGEAVRTLQDKRIAGIETGKKAIEALDKYIQSEIRNLSQESMEDIYRVLGLIKGDVIKNQFYFEKDKHETQP